MPIIRFHIEADAPPHIVAERLRVAVRAEPGFLESFCQIRKPTGLGGPPFVGSVADQTFRLRRAFRGRNSFVPLVRGRIISTDSGARVTGVMFLHPFVAALMAFWLGLAGYGALTNKSGDTIALWGMFIFGLAFTVGAFLHEASRAKQLLTAAVLRDSAGKIADQSNR